MTRSKQRKHVFDRMLKQRLQWHKHARIFYKDAGFGRCELDEDALVILLIELAEMIWRYDLNLSEVTSDLDDMITDIRKKHPPEYVQ